ncbi:hypothetical protein A5886_000139 [Enterococcus sp. 8G7_MSG3316]|uniref:Saccharopine dehydrogenase NADP binding domain-containing protein n=1 Tax=Candidatus Enterococcus testudinis TaxID=1834191 RepID=A0A242A229_9ENTE|nr:saccharopine dehydrogenase NADP-binding domain-containing protein [Enterococcus sp. 8G7_MSG3316]OTN75095.1 hypothetical protein A5886_000139 [Enterococcus sp. 8G7_MSG3316]
MKQIAVVGGHGQVGQVIVNMLVDRGYPVVLMGRNLEKMATFAQTFTPALATRQVDITKENTFPQLTDIDMVIVCLDQNQTHFVRNCQEAGIDYVDISANSDFLMAVSQLPTPDKSRRLVGVGLVDAKRLVWQSAVCGQSLGWACKRSPQYDSVW